MIKLTMVLMGMLMAMGASAAVFTWIDENGEVHYSDVPAGDYSVRVDIESKPTDDQLVAAERQQAVDNELDRQQQAQENQKQADEDKQFDKNDKERTARNCRTATETYESFYNAPRLYKPTDDGGRDYLSSEQMDAARAKAKEDMDKWCN
jgi:hypothetical protein